MDNVADALIRIKNGYLVGKQLVNVRYSKLTLSIVNLLVKEGFLGSCKVIDREIEVGLKYKDKKAALGDVKRISKPGLRVYKNARSLPFVLNGLGVAIVSTSKGVMSATEARKQNIGGEVLAEVW